ncbi:hypothetical protein JCM14076_06610 [Methylosoma difficile]
MIAHAAGDYAHSLKALLPLGQAWEWPDVGLGADLLLGTAQELARVDDAALIVLADAIDLHQPGQISYLLSDYQQVADSALQIIERKPASIGCGMGYRLWSNTAPQSVTPTPGVVLDDDFQPFVVGNVIGTQLWSGRCRYYLRVAFDRSLIDAFSLLEALRVFKQAHVFLFVVDTPNLTD